MIGYYTIIYTGIQLRRDLKILRSYIREVTMEAAQLLQDIESENATAIVSRSHSTLIKNLKPDQFTSKINRSN